MRSLSIFFFLFLTFCAAYAPVYVFAEAYRPASVKHPKIRLEKLAVSSAQDLTRLSLGFSGRPDFTTKSHVASSSLIINIRNAAISSDVKSLIEVNDGMLRTVEIAEHNRTAARVTIQTEPGMNYGISYEDKDGFIISVVVLPPMPSPTTETGKPDQARRAGYLQDLSGFFRHETAYRVAEPEDLTKTRNTFYLAATGRLSSNVTYKASGRVIYDAVFDLTENYPATVEDDQEYEATLRENFLDLSMGDWDARLGKQTVVWGEAVGLFFADVVNAKDLREFVLPDFDYIRIPQWAADVEYTRGPLHLEMVWIPVLEFHKLGLQGSEFPQAVPLPVGTSAVVTGTDEPSDTLKNSELGFRASFLLKGWDLSIFHFYGWDRFPAMERIVAAPDLYIFSPNHKRLNTSGLTFSKEINDVILKGEAVYYHGKHFSVIDGSDPDGLVKKDYIDYLVGVDYTFLEKIDFNFQFMQRIIFDFERTIFREDRVRSSFSVWLKTGLFANRVEPEILLISAIDETDLLIRPKITFRATDHLQARIGLDIFEGSQDGIFGQYDNRDRIYAEAIYDF